MSEQHAAENAAASACEQVEFTHHSFK